jgi:hypothetical protein
MELAEASTRCYRTWIEVSAKLCEELHGQAETVQVKLLRFLQEYRRSRSSMEWIKLRQKYSWRRI